MTHPLKITEVVNQLRGPNGCPWNAARTPSQLIKSLKDETDELEEAIRGGALWQIEEEVGDLLFNLVALVECFAENGMTDLARIDEIASDKMISRHPYVFGGEDDPGPEVAVLRWEQAKSEELEQKFSAWRAVAYRYRIYGLGDTSLTDTIWLKRCTKDLAELLVPSTTELLTSTSVLSQEADNSSSNYLVIGEDIDFLLLQPMLSTRMIVAQGLATCRIDPPAMFEAIVRLFQTDQVEATLFPVFSGVNY